MLYNYSNPYTNSLMNMYGGGNNYQPISNVNSQNQQALNLSLIHISEPTRRS